MNETLLYAPEWYWQLPERERELGRCGAGGGFWERIVPDRIYGLSVRPACQIHDRMYYAGKNINDKREADRVFLNNLLRIIDASSENNFMRWLRRRAAIKYYAAVDLLGGPAFWVNKNGVNEWGAT